MNIGVAEAILGGRVSLDAPGGTVRVTIPPGTSSGTRMRLRGKGFAGPDGARQDLVARYKPRRAGGGPVPAPRSTAMTVARTSASRSCAAVRP